VAIIIQGLAQTASAWAAVCRLLSPYIRVYSYDRSGLGKSDASEIPPTSTNIALELDLLLAIAGVGPPYVLVAHSWGGILAREFIARSSENDIVGCVFVEANQERTLEVLDWRPLIFWALAAEVNFMKVSGLPEHKMTEEEWNQYIEDDAIAVKNPQAEAEFDEYAPSFEILAEKRQSHRSPPLMGKFPVSVIKGQNAHELRKIYDAVVKVGYGTEAERASFNDWLGKFDEKDRELQSELRLLSEKSRFIEALRSGHNVHLTQPDVIVEEVRWVANQYLEMVSKTEKK
jgi:pimeloyl-ACP methyl ester carboxylesterase